MSMERATAVFAVSASVNTEQLIATEDRAIHSILLRAGGEDLPGEAWAQDVRVGLSEDSVTRDLNYNYSPDETKSVDTKDRYIAGATVTASGASTEGGPLGPTQIQFAEPIEWNENVTLEVGTSGSSGENGYVEVVVYYTEEE